MTGEPRGVSRVVAGFSSFDREYRASHLNSKFPWVKAFGQAWVKPDIVFEADNTNLQQFISEYREAGLKELRIGLNKI